MKWKFIGIEPRHKKTFYDWVDIIELENGILLREGVELILPQEWYLYGTAVKPSPTYVVAGTTLVVKEVESWDKRISSFKGGTRCFYPSYEEPVITFYQPDLWADGKIYNPAHPTAEICVVLSEFVKLMKWE